MLIAQGNNNDWMQLVIPIVVFVLYSAANIMKTRADQKNKAPRPAPPPRANPVPADAPPHVLLGQDPLAKPAPPAGPAKPTSQQLELERLLRELGVPRTMPGVQPPPLASGKKPPRPPRRPTPARNAPGAKEQVKPSKRASDRHLKSQLEKRHAESQASRIEKQHLSSQVEKRPLDTESAVDPALLLAKAHQPRVSQPAMVQNLRQAFMMSIVLGPPIAMRNENGSTEPLL